MLSRKCVYRRAKIENKTPQKKERRLKSMQVNQRERIENQMPQEKERRLQLCK